MQTNFKIKYFHFCICGRNGQGTGEKEKRFLKSRKKLPGKEKMPVPDSVKNRKDKMFTNVHSISDKYGHFHTGVPW